VTNTLLAWWKIIRSALLAWRKNIRIAFISAIILKALEGIIGNRADTLFTQVLPFIQTTVIENLLSAWYVMVFVALSCVFICICFIQRIRMLEHALAIDHKVLKLDDLLLLGLASWVPSLDVEKEKERIITDILLETIAEFDGQIHRAALLLPDVSGEYLQCWANYEMSQDSINNMKFYIGKDKIRRQREGGVAGDVFHTKDLQVGHLRQVNGNWVCEDCPNYMKFPGRRPFPPYRSFVNIPILGIDTNAPDSSATCLGVICFDSRDKDVFDHAARQTVLRTLARRITAALLIFKLYQDLSPTQDNSNS
jgi:hypothetical protein